MAHPEGYEFRGREGQVHVPEKLYGIVESVLGLDTRRVGSTRGCAAPPHARSNGKKSAASKTSNPWPGTFISAASGSALRRSIQPDRQGSERRDHVVQWRSPMETRTGGCGLAALNTYFTNVLGGTLPAVHQRGRDGARK